LPVIGATASVMVGATLLTVIWRVWRAVSVPSVTSSVTV
jgi:hypothetical protein